MKSALPEVLFKYRHDMHNLNFLIGFTWQSLFELHTELVQHTEWSSRQAFYEIRLVTTGNI